MINKDKLFMSCKLQIFGTPWSPQLPFGTPVTYFGAPELPLELFGTPGTYFGPLDYLGSVAFI